MFRRWSHLFSLLLALPALAGCDDDGLELSIELRTDLVAGEEFASIRADVWQGGPVLSGPATFSRESQAPSSRALFHSTRIGEVGALAPGDYWVRVQLLDRRGAPVAQRRVLLAVSASYALTVIITRDCGAITCPGSGPAERTECSGGRCVEPTCAEQGESACPAPECTSDVACPTAAACATPRCVTGVCLYDLADDRCASDEYCAPEGCLPRAAPITDGGVVGPWVAVSSGGRVTCGLRADRSVRCWGDLEHDIDQVPSGSYRSVSAGSEYACALRSDSTLTCWGNDLAGMASPPSGEFVAVAVDEPHSCGVRADGTLTCWGQADGIRTIPTGSFIDVDVQPFGGCALRSNGAAACWGQLPFSPGSEPGGAFTSIEVSVVLGCGTRIDGAVFCWGGGLIEDVTVDPTPPPGAFAEVSAGGVHACGLRPTGRIECWGFDGAGQASPPAGVFRTVSAGAEHTCAVTRTGEITCWGANDFGQASVPPG